METLEIIEHRVKRLSNGRGKQGKLTVFDRPKGLTRASPSSHGLIPYIASSSYLNVYPPSSWRSRRSRSLALASCDRSSTRRRAVGLCVVSILITEVLLTFSQIPALGGTKSRVPVGEEARRVLECRAQGVRLSPVLCLCLCFLSPCPLVLSCELNPARLLPRWLSNFRVAEVAGKGRTSLARVHCALPHRTMTESRSSPGLKAVCSCSGQ